MKKITLPIIFAIITSCSEESLNVSDESILNFANADEILAYSTNRMSNFVSYDDIYHAALENISNAETEAEHAKVLEDNSDVIYLSDDTYTPWLTNSVYRKIINRDRMYRSGDYVHKVFDDQHIITTTLNNLEVLKEIKSISNLKDGFSVFRYQEGNFVPTNGRTAANCGADLRQDYFYNNTNCKDDRRAWVRGYTWYAISGNYYTPSVISEGWGERRSGVWCNWNQYATEIWTRNASYTVSATINGSPQNFSFTKPDYNANGDEYEHIIHQGAVAGAILWAGGVAPSIQFTQIHAECRTRGTNNNWAVLHCQ